MPSYVMLILMLLVFGAIITGAVVVTLVFAMLRPPRLTDGRAIWILQRLSPGDFGLTGRQVDVLALIMQGKSNKAICRALDLSEPTVKSHVSAILRALKVSNRTEIVIAVSALKWELPPIAGS